MASAFNFIRDLFLTFSILFSMMFTPYASETYEAKKPDMARLVFNAVSDVHVETNNPESYGNLEKVLRGLKANKSGNATVFLGDNTMNGQVTENFLFFSAAGTMLKSENTLVALGNHDLGNGNGEYNKMINRYTRYHNLFLKNKIDTPYYYRIVNGYYMIFLASENMGVNSFYVSDVQLKWLEATLEAANISGNPVFVFSHHPLNYVESENRNLLFDALKNYNNIYTFHGHTHMNYTVYNVEGITCVNLPRVTETVDYASGTGVTVEVYNDEIILRERDFINGEWLSEKTFSIEK